MDAVLEFAFLRYYETSGLFGTPERCRETVDKLKGIGVDEIACLIDFGIDTDEVLDSLPLLDRIRRESNAGAGAQADPEAQPAALDQSVASQLTRHGVTHMQCTPSMARMLSMQEESHDTLASVEHLFVGGEAFRSHWRTSCAPAHSAARSRTCTVRPRRPSGRPRGPCTAI